MTKPHKTQFSPPCTGKLYPHTAHVDGVVFENEKCRTPGCIYETSYRVVSSPVWDAERARQARFFDDALLWHCPAPKEPRP